MKNDLKKIKLSGQFVYLHIVKWNKEKGFQGLGKKERLIEYVKAQIPNRATQRLNPLEISQVALFKDNFINNKDGIILCVNTPVYIEKFFQESPKREDYPTETEKPGSDEEFKKMMLDWNTQDKALDSARLMIRFTMVFMPEEFKGRSNQALSSPYVYGEKLLVSASFQKDKLKAEAAQTGGNKQLYLYYTDTNSKGRSAGGRGGAGAGTWS